MKAISLITLYIKFMSTAMSISNARMTLITCKAMVEVRDVGLEISLICRHLANHSPVHKPDGGQHRHTWSADTLSTTEIRVYSCIINLDIKNFMPAL